MAEPTITARRAEFVYNGMRLAAIASGAPIVPVPWDEQEKPFYLQFLEVIDRQIGPHHSTSPEELHGSLMQAYIDLAPYAQLSQLERDKDAVFVALCEIARLYIYEVTE